MPPSLFAAMIFHAPPRQPLLFYGSTHRHFFFVYCRMLFFMSANHASHIARRQKARQRVARSLITRARHPVIWNSAAPPILRVRACRGTRRMASTGSRLFFDYEYRKIARRRPSTSRCVYARLLRQRHTAVCRCVNAAACKRCGKTENIRVRVHAANRRRATQREIEKAEAKVSSTRIHDDPVRNRLTRTLRCRASTMSSSAQTDVFADKIQRLQRMQAFDAA